MEVQEEGMTTFPFSGAILQFELATLGNRPNTASNHQVFITTDEPPSQFLPPVNFNYIPRIILCYPWSSVYTYISSVFLCVEKIKLRANSPVLFLERFLSQELKLNEPFVAHKSV
jgi:hypothetical protein